MVVCALMRSATAEAYQEVLHLVKQETDGFVFPAYMGDYDAAMRAAVRAEHPGVRVYGCLFHYAQSLVRRASSPQVGLAREIRQPGEILKNFVGLIALPLLPAEDIVSVFDLLAQEALQASPRVRSRI